jgi:hypothetical protein
MQRKLVLLSPLFLLLLVAGLIIWGLTAPKGDRDKEEHPVIELPDDHWIVGDWYYIDSAENTTFFESWKPRMNMSISPKDPLIVWTDSIFGRGYSISNNDTAVWERLVIDTKPDKWTFTATVEGQAPVVFTETQRSDRRLRFENPDHDFPKSIEYVRKDSMLTATVSNETRTLHFTFTLKHE